MLLDSNDSADARGWKGRASSSKEGHGDDSHDSSRGWHLGDLESWDSSRGGDSVKVGNTTLQVVCGDITQERSDVIVNSSNRKLDLSQGIIRYPIVICHHCKNRSFCVFCKQQAKYGKFTRKIYVQK